MLVYWGIKPWSLLFFFNFLYTSNSSYMRDRHPFYLKAPATFVPKQQLLVCGIIFLYIYDCEQWPNTIVITCGYHCTICCRKIKSSKVKKNMILFLYFNIWHYWKNTLYWLFYCGKWAFEVSFYHLHRCRYINTLCNNLNNVHVQAKWY